MFAAVTKFLALNRDGLTSFTHPNTGETATDELRDHRDHAVWMGEVRPLKLSLFGGYGKSGYGREKGREALWNYVQTKNIAYRTR